MRLALCTGSRSLPNWVVEGAVTASFRIEQDSFDHRAHIAAHTLTVIGKHRADPADVRRAWVAGDQRLNQLLADKRADIWVVKNVIEAGLEIANCRCRRLAACSAAE